MSEIIDIIDGDSHIRMDSETLKNAKIKVVGVGGAGGNALNRMRELELYDVEFIAINTDASALENSLADTKISIGKVSTKNLGAGANPEVGRQAIHEDRAEVEEALKNTDMIFLAAGMGGGTGTGASPVVAEIAKSLGILTVAVVTMPFKFEGPVRKKMAKSGLAQLKEHVDSIIVINNQNVLSIIEKSTSTGDAYKAVDQVLCDAVRGVCDIIMRHGTVNIDFNDVQKIMLKGGAALMGTGIAEGENRALLAAERAITCPLLGDVKIKGAGGMLVNVSHGENFTMQELDSAMSYLAETVGISLDDDDDDEESATELIFGDCVIPELGESVKITVFVTKFQEEHFALKAPQAMRNEGVSGSQTSLDLGVEKSIEQKVSREVSKQRPTTNFAALVNQAGLNSSPRTQSFQNEIQFNGFQDSTLDVRSMNQMNEEVLVPMHLRAAAQAPIASNRNPLFEKAQPNSVSGTADDDTVCPAGLDLSEPPLRRQERSLEEADTRSMETFRNSFMASGNDF